MPSIERLTIAIPTEMLAIVQAAVESGDYASVSEVFRDALRTWKYKRSLLRDETEDIREGVSQGLEDLRKGKLKEAEEIFSRLENKYQNS